MKKPFLQDAAFLADVASARAFSTPPHPHAPLYLWWLGQSGFLALWNDLAVLFDPYLSDSLTRKYAATDKPHVRMTERVVAPEALTGITLVTATHAHTDHLDPDTLRPLTQVNPEAVLVCPEAIRVLARERSGLTDERILGADVPAAGRATWLSLPAAPVRILPVPAAHETLDRDAEGRLLHLGFIVELGPFRIYHSGDTVRYDGMADRLQRHAVDVAILPINGRRPERRVAGNLWGREAAQLASDIEARMAIPCHYDMFEFNTATPDDFMEACRRLGQTFCVLRPGERCTLAASAPAAPGP